jgi:hypothetical protein
MVSLDSARFNGNNEKVIVDLVGESVWLNRDGFLLYR